MMEALRTYEASVDSHFTRQYNPEDSSEHHTRRRENLKSHTGCGRSTERLTGSFQKPCSKSMILQTANRLSVNRNKFSHFEGRERRRHKRES
jgi:hypothetical protein